MKDKFTIDKLREGNCITFEMLFTQWYKPLSGYAYSIIGNIEDAEDIVQNVFYKLWDRKGEIDIRTSVKSYLYRMVHNSCMNKIKQHKIRSEHNQIYASETSNYVYNTLISSELQKQIEEAIEELPPRCKDVFVLSRYKQLSYAEIAGELNISTNTVETQIVKALKLLRQKLKDYLPFILILYFLS